MYYIHIRKTYFGRSTYKLLFKRLVNNNQIIKE